MKYGDEFKCEAVNWVFDGQKAVSVARELGVSQGLIHKWKKEIRDTNSNEVNEVIELKKELRKSEMEIEILKKAAHFSGNGG